MIPPPSDSVKPPRALARRRAARYTSTVPTLAALLLLAASPARAQLAKQQLCGLTGVTYCPEYGSRPSPPPRERPERPSCPECEAAERAEMDRNLATMEHPVPAVSLEDETLAYLAEDAAAAGEAMEGVDLALAAAISLPALELALDAAVVLVALNIVADAASIPLPPALRIPVWLNMLSLSQAASPAASAECQALETAAQSACANLPSTTCSDGDDCATLLAKRKSRLACEKAWFDLRRPENKCSTPRDDAQSRTDNAREVSDCGQMISNKSECCPPEVKSKKDAACPEKGLPGCKKESKLSETALMDFHADKIKELCQDVADRKSAADDCRSARQVVEERCFEALPDAGHIEAVRLLGVQIGACESFLGTTRRLGLCP